MSSVTFGPGGELTLPEDVLRRCGLTPDRPVQVIETEGGLVLVPLHDGPVTPALAEELDARQERAGDAWNEFPSSCRRTSR